MNARGASLLIVLGGLVTAGSGAAAWVTAEGVRHVGGVPVATVSELAGTGYAPLALPSGLLLFAGGLAATAIPARLRRSAGGALLALALGAAAVVADGLVRATAGTGRLTSAPWLCAAGVLVALLGATAMLRSGAAAPLLDERYTVEGGGPGDEEWGLASDEPDGAE